MCVGSYRTFFLSLQLYPINDWGADDVNDPCQPALQSCMNRSVSPPTPLRLNPKSRLNGPY